ncbi:MAG TPA: hypothetical protein VIE65_19405 [Methylobacter sp.]|jgi:hypothetical protein
MPDRLFNEQHPATITAFGGIYVLSTPLAVGVNCVLVPQRRFPDEPENGVRLPPAIQGIALSVWNISDSSEAAKVWPLDGDSPPSITTIEPETGVTYKAQGGGWQAQLM